MSDHGSTPTSPQLHAASASTTCKSAAWMITSTYWPASIPPTRSPPSSANSNRLRRSASAARSRPFTTFDGNGYGAFSVSRDRRAAVTRYIERQEEHHRRRTLRDELNERSLNSAPRPIRLTSCSGRLRGRTSFFDVQSPGRARGYDSAARLRAPSPVPSRAEKGALPTLRNVRFGAPKGHRPADDESWVNQSWGRTFVFWPFVAGRLAAASLSSTSNPRAKPGAVIRRRAFTRQAPFPAPLRKGHCRPCEMSDSAPRRSPAGK